MIRRMGKRWEEFAKAVFKTVEEKEGKKTEKIDVFEKEVRGELYKNLPGTFDEE